LQQPATRYGTSSDDGGRLSAPSLTILGTEFGCGKTTLMCGLSALLREQGFKVGATKPIFVGANSEREAERAFISSLSRTTSNSLSIAIERGSSLTNRQWLQTVKAGAAGPDFMIVEMPGGLATPLTFEPDAERAELYWRDSADLAKQLGFPCLLVAKHSDDAIEKLSLGAAFAKSKGLTLLGLATVETGPNVGRAFELILSRDRVELALHTVTGIPYLGCIKYSESISVNNVNQGNLIKMTAGGIELLSILKGLNLRVPRAD
jgi:dethiobiotin synthetase